MSRRTNGLPALARPRVQLAHHPARCRKPPKTLIGLASRALYVAGLADQAEAMRDRLRAAAPPDYLPILRDYVDFWPAGLAAERVVGDPDRHWASARIPEEQQRRVA